jgi:hypothetical protein
MQNLHQLYPRPLSGPHGRPGREPEHVTFQREAAELREQRRRERRARLIRRIPGL